MSKKTQEENYVLMVWDDLFERLKEKIGFAATHKLMKMGNFFPIGFSGCFDNYKSEDLYFSSSTRNNIDIKFHINDIAEALKVNFPNLKRINISDYAAPHSTAYIKKIFSVHHVDSVSGDAGEAKNV